MSKVLFLVFIMAATSLGAQNINIDSLKQVIKSELKQEARAESADPQDEAVTKSRLLQWSKFSIRGYGAINYYNYGRYDTDKGIRDKIDPERLNFYLDYHFTDRLKMNSEIEFEHGGTGATMELDVQEEFGEYETEVEKGGEVKVEQLNLEYAVAPYLNIKLGRLKVLFNIAQKLDDPDEYFTTSRPEMENVILPLGWYENGIELYGTFLNHKLIYHAALVNGLDSSGFSSANFVKLGYEGKFEMMNAENFAVFGNLDYRIGKHKYSFAGISWYYGNTTDNRPKPDLKVPGHLTLLGAHASYFDFPFRFTGQVIYGDLENSESISIRNAGLPANLNTKKTAVGKNALGYSGEFGYEIFHHIHGNSDMQIYPFFRYEYYNTMYRTAPGITANKRWEKRVITGGINWFVFPHVVLKAQYSARKLGSDNVDISTGIIHGKQRENIFSAGLGFEF